MFNRIRKPLFLALVTTLSLGLSLSCDKKKTHDGAGDARAAGTGGKTANTDGQAANTKGQAAGTEGQAGGSPCTEKNQLEFTPAEGDGLRLEAPFQVKAGTGYLSGMSYNGKSLAKLGYVAIGNYDVKLGPYGVEMPGDPGQVVVLISFKTASQDVDMEKQLELYKTLQVPAGEYARPGWMDPGQIFQVNCFVGGRNDGPALTGQDARGQATLTVSSPGWLCGSLDLTSGKGSRVKGTFAVKVARDFWAK